MHERDFPAAARRIGGANWTPWLSARAAGLPVELLAPAAHRVELRRRGVLEGEGGRLDARNRLDYDLRPMRLALLPAKPPSSSKTRLAPQLTNAERSAIATAMFEDVLEALCASRSLDGVIVVSAHPGFLDRAARLGAEPVAEGEPRGLNGAVRQGTLRSLERRASSLLVVLSDLPAISPADVDAVVEGTTAPEVRLVRSHDGAGTNALLRTPPDAIRSRFGGRSFSDHAASAELAGTRWLEVRAPGIAFDVDTIDDLERALASPSSSRTYAEAMRLGLDRRFGERVEHGRDAADLVSRSTRGAPA